LIAGIYVEPEDGSAKIKGWLIKQPPSKDVRIEELMRCQDGDEIFYPDLPTLKRELAATGIDLTICKTIGDYGQALYDAGILPGPMNTTTDRMLFGNLLGTTFRGGISKEVAARLKDYLLPSQTHVQDLVRGLQECTNEVLRTRHAVADAEKELALLESTYGIGKEAVLTAIRCITDDISTSEEALRTLRGNIDNKNKSSQSLAETIPALSTEIETTEATKKNMLATALLRNQELSHNKEKTHIQLSKCEAAMKSAAATLKQFNDGGKLWKQLVVPHMQNHSFDDVKTWFDLELRKIQHDIFVIDNEIRALIEEDERLSNERSSAASEHLAEVLGGQSLEQALGHVSANEAIALEMALGGTVDGVVGVDVSALADLTPTSDLPTMFWLSETAPIARLPKETGDWYVAATAGGYIVASKDKAPAFGREARQQRRTVIATKLANQKKARTAANVELDDIEAKKTLLLTNAKDISFYLENRSQVLAIDKSAKDTKKAFEDAKQVYDEMTRLYSYHQDEIFKIEVPYDEKITGLRIKLTAAEKSHTTLQTEIAEVKKRIGDEEARLKASQAEYSAARGILGEEFDPFCAASMELPLPAKNVSGQQTQRIAQLTLTLGDETLRLNSFREVDAEQRVSIIRLWPDLMTIVRDSVNIELADADSGDLIQAMRQQRGRLDTDLKTWENELGIKAKNIYMTINGSVRSQMQKIARLSKLGQVIEFGNVTGIQIRLLLRPRMMDVLLAFADQFADQRTLFGKEKPVDQLLKEFFDASMSGGVRLSGEQLLDYRNYVDLVIEARRKGSDKWDLAASLCGTEVIGGGLAIALMLVRSIAARGELAGSGIKASEIRPIFAVDEIARLNDEGQRLLVNFAKRENFQLVVTAPSIKPTYDCTLYALTRKFDPNNQLIIRGIKHRGPSPQEAA